MRHPLDRPEPEPAVTITIGRLIAMLRTALNWNQSTLARKSKVKRSLISEYENDTKTPDASTIKRLLDAMSFRWSAIGHAEAFLLLLLAERRSGGPRPGAIPAEDALREGAREIGRAAARLTELAGVLKREEAGTGAAALDDQPVSAAHLWDRLRPLASHRQKALVRENPAFWKRSLCALLCSESEKLCPASPSGAVRLAELAVTLAELIAGVDARHSRLIAFALAHLGNALRVRNDHEGARKAFAKADDLWRTDAEGDESLEYAQILSLKASFFRAERRLAEALDLLDQAVAICRTPKLRALLLVKRAKTHEERGDLEAAIAILRTVEVPPGEGHTLLCVRHNLADNLTKAGAFREAEALIPEVRRLTQEHGQELDRVRLLWVEGRIAGGLGQIDEAIGSLTRVRGHFAAEDLDYDTALVSLELASIYAEEGRTTEVKTLARHMVPIFQAKRVPAEALKALALFRQAAEQERATLELVSGLISFLRRARHDPGLSFAAEG